MLILAGTTDTSLMLVGPVILLALWIDWRWGEPPLRWHPVVWMGTLLGRFSGWVAPLVGQNEPNPNLQNQHEALQAFVRGTLIWLSLGILITSLAGTLQYLVGRFLPSWAQIVVLAFLLKPLFAWRMLRDEVMAVQNSLNLSLHAGQQQLARLVSRDVSRLDSGTVAESAIETLAENLNDSVIAPLFWFCLFGLPGAALYRFANTADAMWGYPGERNGRNWQWAGKWAARADDVLSWLPARITALLIMLVQYPIRCCSCYSTLKQEACKTPSPNSGWPMAAMALQLNVQLRKPAVYLLHPSGVPAQPEDISRACQLSSRVVCLCAAGIGMTGLIVASIHFLFG